MNLNRYNLLKPDNNKIYYGFNSKDIATKIFTNYNINNNLNLLDIVLEDNETKITYNYLAMSKNKYLKYKEIIDKYYSNQIGSSYNSQNDAFYNDLGSITNNMNNALSDLTRLLKSKENIMSTEQDNQVIVVLEKINKNILSIDNNVRMIKDDMIPNQSNRVDKKSVYKKNSCNIM